MKNVPEMLHVPGGTGFIGSNRMLSALPEMEVSMAPFWMSRYPITVGQWLGVIHSEDPYDGLLSARQPNRTITYLGNVNNYPVTSISWNEVQIWLEKASKYFGMTLALPTEFQWEYATRFDNYLQTTYSTDYLKHVDEGLNHCLHVGSTGHKTPLGFEDLVGNIWEMCSDNYISNTGDGTRLDDFIIRSPNNRTVRGTCYLSKGADLAPSTRTYVLQSGTNSTVGFRVVCMDYPVVDHPTEVMDWFLS
jgi:formylglycine-generating enzyme required for sulfatase activity